MNIFFLLPEKMILKGSRLKDEACLLHIVIGFTLMSEVQAQNISVEHSHSVMYIFSYSS